MPGRGRLEPQLTAYICSIADLADGVFQEWCLFLISHDSRCCFGTIRIDALLACSPKIRNRKPFVPAGAAPARRRIACDALEHGREMRLRAEANSERNLGQGRLRVRQQRFRVFDALMQEI